MRLIKRAVRWAIGRPSQASATLVDFMLHPLAGRMRRAPDRWVFGHQDGEFAGNPKYLYLWLLQNSSLRLSWITGSWRTWRQLRRQGYPAALRWSPAGIYRTLTAGAAFYAHRTADVNATLLNGAMLINLWHGVGLKAIHLGHASGLTSQAQRHAGTRWGRARFRTYLVQPDVVATTSDFMQQHFASQFRLPEERCPQIGYPRIDAALDPALMEAVAVFDGGDFALHPAGYRHAYIYLPTSRDSRRPLLAQAIPDPAQLRAALTRANAYLYIKLHPRTQEALPTEFQNIGGWPAHIDVQDHLHKFDAMITDYSSVLYDYVAVRNSGAVLYTFDLKEYLANDRDLLYPFEENVVGLRIATFAALCLAIENGGVTAPIEPRRLHAVRQRFWGVEQSLHSPRVAAFVAQRLTLLSRISHAGGSDSCLVKNVPPSRR